MENNIKLTNETIRMSLESIEKRLNKSDIKFYDNYYREISNDKNYILYLDIMYYDAYLSLNYRNKTGLITQEERNMYKKLELLLLEEYAPYISFNNERNVRNFIISESSKFRKYNELTKSKMHYSLDSIDKGIISKINHIIANEKYIIDIKELESIIIRNSDLESLIFEIQNYLEFLYFKNKRYYKELLFKIRTEINIFDTNSDDELSKIEIKDFINKVLNKYENIKIYDITKNR